MEKQIEIALLYARQRVGRNRFKQKHRRRKQRHQDEFQMLNSFQMSFIDRCENECVQSVSLKYKNNDCAKIPTKEERFHNQSNSYEDSSQMLFEQTQEAESSQDSFVQQDNQLLIDSFYSENETNEISLQLLTQQRLHSFTNVKTNEYCEFLLKTLREAKLSKLQSNKFISLLKSALPEPNNMPSSLKKLLSVNNIEDIFLKRRVCVLCTSEIPYQLENCSICFSNDETKFAMIYDVDVDRVVPVFIQKRHELIEEYKRLIQESSSTDVPRDIPNGLLYKRLVKECYHENIISFILHIDGISLTKSSKLKLWLLSASIVELRPKLRQRRQNMLVLSIWIAYIDPPISLWLDKIIESLVHLKSRNITIQSKLNYRIKIFALTGDCPALKLSLNFIGHGGYWCCWLCYIKGIHEEGKRQYHYGKDTELRTEISYSHESADADLKKKTIFGHKGVSPFVEILDIPLPSSIIIDYMHVTLLGHGKRLIVTIYNQLKPIERLAVDKTLKDQKFPHFFNRRMRSISDFGFVKATELRNILFYGLLPLFQTYIPMEKLSHLALFVCGIRLFHGHLLIGYNVSQIAQNMINLFYKDHNEFYHGLQNFVLHLHTHFGIIYDNYGPLNNLGCFGQEDLIGYVSSNHQGTRYHGELICHHYNIDFCLKNDFSSKIVDTPMDRLNLNLDNIEHAADCHRLLCNCDKINQCMLIYRRYMINESVYHSVLYEKPRKSISYFVEYFTDESFHDQQFGIIEWFFICGKKAFILIRNHSKIVSYSDNFRTSKYYTILKTALDSLFIVLSIKSAKYDLVPIELIGKHCIVFDMKDHLIVTTVAAYEEHD